MSTKQVAKKETTEMAAMEGYEDFAGGGFENQDNNDVLIPSLRILQALSPVLEENDSLKAGMLYNPVTGDWFAGKDGVTVIPSVTNRAFVEFIPREQGGGFVAAHDPASDLVQKCQAEQQFGQYTTEGGNELVETFTVFAVMETEGGYSPVVLNFKSAGIKKYKGWMTRARTIQFTDRDGKRYPAPLFAHKYRLTTVMEKNTKGNFHNWNITFAGDNAAASRVSTDSEEFQAVLSLRQMVEEGNAKADHSEGADSGEGTAGKSKF